MTPNEFILRARQMETNFRASLRMSKQAVAVAAKGHFDKSFQNEGFSDTSLQKWPKRSPDRRPQDKTLHETGKLRSRTTVRVIARGVVIVNRVHYAGYHNYGIGQKKRQFIGKSILLNNRITTIFKKSLTGALKP